MLQDLYTEKATRYIIIMTERNFCLNDVSASKFSVIDSKSISLWTKQGIHRHQTLPRYRNTTSGSRLNIQPSTHRHTAKHEVIHKTGTT